MSFWTDERVERLKNMLAGGMSYSAAAMALGTTKGAVSGHIDRRRPKRHNDGGTPSPRELPEPIPGGVATIDLTARMCRFPLSADAPWRHCGQEAEPLSAWCKFHRAAVYQKART